MFVYFDDSKSPAQLESGKQQYENETVLVLIFRIDRKAATEKQQEEGQQILGESFIHLVNKFE